VIEEVPLRRFVALVALLTVTASACGDSTEPPSTSTAAAVTAPDGVVLAPNGTSATSGPLPRVELERTLPEIMAKAGVPGVSFAVLEEGKVAWVLSFGVRSTESNEPADVDTVFAAASFSKPVFAYLVMLLTEDGTLELDRPLEEYLGQPLGELPRYADLAGVDLTGAITARHVLSHSVGFPNSRLLTDDGKLRFLFEPGTRFSYSGEGIALLQQVVEAVTGRGLEELARELIFDPVGMTRTSYVWQEEFEDNHAVPHDEFERARRLNRPRDADAAGSMMTTAGDYARFLSALLTAEGAQRELVEAMLVPQVMIDSQQMFGPLWERTAANEANALAWGLGWGRFDTARGRAFFHTGHDFGWQNYTVTHFDAGAGVVFLSNSDNFESVARELVAAALGDEGSPFDWLGYPVFDPAQRREPPPDPVAIELERPVMERYVGEYEFQGDRFNVDLRQDRLWLTDGDEETELLALSDTVFFVADDDARFRFELADDGTVERLTILIEGLELPAPRLSPSPAPAP
jgi:CubicO group peptidase (beta-lactamase class C family)